MLVEEDNYRNDRIMRAAYEGINEARNDLERVMALENAVLRDAVKADERKREQAKIYSEIKNRRYR